MKTFLIIGAGNIAKHFQYYLSAIGQTPLTWDRGQDPHLLQTKINECTHILLAISDSALEAFFRTKLEGQGKVVVHFSGALFFEGAIAAHPLMSFGPELYSLETYQCIHFMVSGCESLGVALPGLPNPFSILVAEAKPLYHALCVLGGNFPVLLWQRMFQGFAQLGIPAEAASLYLETVLANTLANPSTALTGPLARKDAKMISKNLSSLAGDPFEEVYRAFVQAATPELVSSIKEFNSTGFSNQKERPS